MQEATSMIKTREYIQYRQMALYIFNIFVS